MVPLVSISTEFDVLDFHSLPAKFHQHSSGTFLMFTLKKSLPSHDTYWDTCATFYPSWTKKKLQHKEDLRVKGQGLRVRFRETGPYLNANTAKHTLLAVNLGESKVLTLVKRLLSLNVTRVIPFGTFGS